MLDVVAAVVRRNGRVLIARRAPGRHLAGYWEFPGGKVEPGETAEAALAREMLEEFGATVRVGAYLGDSMHDDGVVAVRLMAYAVFTSAPLSASRDHDRIAWVRPGELAGYQLAPADVPLLRQFTTPSCLL